jgi:(E)-4-hydroxy-3-methyl-but-2-enyl pyrophosphate reductase
MKVKLAKTAGFCMGVRRALEMVLRASHEEHKPIFTYGPLIHNPQVLDLLQAKGICSCSSIEDIKSGCVVIRAHGVPLETKKKMLQAGLKVVDATCPHVARVQVILKEFTKKGYLGLIVGDENHPEVMGLLGYTHGRGVVVKSPRDLEAIDPQEKVVLVAQTTQQGSVFEEIERKARSRFKSLEVRNTICGATRRRQEEALSLARNVEAMVVVGGYNSGNTQRLVRISEEAGVKTFHVETEGDLDLKALSQMNSVGITAGASTPNWLIKKVTQRVKQIRGKGESLIRNMAFRAIKFLLQSDLYVAMGAASHTYAGMNLQGLENFHHLTTALMTSMFYLYSMHVLNRFMDKEAAQYNDPDRTQFLLRFKTLLIFTGVASALGALALSAYTGAVPFLFLFLISLLGTFYSVPLLPTSLKKSGRPLRLKDIPGSKSLSVAGGWASVTVLLPLLGTDMAIGSSTIAALFFVFIMAYIRSALIEVMDLQGDLIVGKETLPILIGEKKTLKFLGFLVASLSLFMAVVYFMGWGSSLFLWLELCCAYAAGYLWIYRKQLTPRDEGFEFLVESNAILAGIITILWNYWGGL